MLSNIEKNINNIGMALCAFVLIIVVIGTVFLAIADAGSDYISTTPETPQYTITDEEPDLAKHPRFRELVASPKN